VFSSVNLNTDNSSVASIQEHASAGDYRLINWQNRANKRLKWTIAIIYKYFNPENFSDEFTMEEGIAYNYSLNGLYFETTTPIPLDMPVYIEVKDGFPSNPGPDVHEGHHAEVKWCKKKDNESGPYYCMGIQFYEPITQDNRNKLLISAAF
jgi:hypothetical protein